MQAAQAHGAKQLMAMCEHRMAMDLAGAERSEAWGELSEEVRERVRGEQRRLEAERAQRREAREVLQKMPCILASPIKPPKSDKRS